MFEVSNLSFGYIKKPLCLKDVSFKLKEGQVLSVLGGEGMGKTALLRVLCGLEKQYYGKISIDNKDINLIDKTTFKISYLPKEPVLFENKSVLDNLNYLYKTCGMDLPQESELIKFLEEFGLKISLKTKVKKLSNCDKKILAILRSYIKRPILLLIDEQMADENEEDSLKIKNAILKLLNENSALKYAISVSEHEKSMLNKDCILYLSYSAAIVTNFKNLISSPIDLFTYNYTNACKYDYILKKENGYYLFDFEIKKIKKREEYIFNNSYKLSDKFKKELDSIQLLEGEQILVTLCINEKLDLINDRVIEKLLESGQGHLFEAMTASKII